MTPAAALSPHALQLIQTLVGINTVSQHSNLALIDFAQAKLAKLGVTSRLSFNADKTKANLFATLGRWARASPPASSSRATPTPCRGTAKTGHATRSWPRLTTVASTGAAAAT